jgi:hypothetical protein
MDVSELGVRKDGTSIYRRPNETRYVTLAQLDLEETVMKHARSAVGQLISKARAQQVLEGSTLSPNSARADRLALQWMYSGATLALPRKMEKYQKYWA